jgi:DNA-binding PucR family transcriptional regulator
VGSRAQAVGFNLERPQRVVIIDSPGSANEGETLFHAVRRALGGEGGALTVPRGRTVVVLCAADRDWEKLRLAVQSHPGGGRCRLGLGGRCVDLADFPRSHREAQLALTMNGVSGGGERVTAFDDLGVYRILAEAHDTSSVERFVREWLGRLLDYDAEKRSTLVATLAQYFEHGRNYDATADALAVHRSTLKYRLQRIKDISGHQLADPDTLFNLQLATRARKTLLALRGEDL